MCAMMQKLRVSSIDMKGSTMRACREAVNRTAAVGILNAEDAESAEDYEVRASIADL